ncbi:arsenical-resistance protein, partial [candidate division WOR-3 bacterium]|nr:arsenical-resistance protein [candidate division WOR-3 bacterium]
METKGSSKGLGIWEKYLTLWVFLCIIIGIGIGRLFPG